MSVAVLALCFSPWAYTVARIAVLRQGLGHKIGWIERPDLYSLLEYYAILNGELNFPLTLICGFSCSALRYCCGPWLSSAAPERRPTGAPIFWLLSLASLLPIALPSPLAKCCHSQLWHPRYLIIVAVPYMILIAVAAHRLRPNWVKAAVILLMVGWAAVAGFKELNGENLSLLFSDHKVAWEALEHQMAQAEGIQDSVINVYAFDGSASIPIRFYLDEAHERRFRVVTVLAPAVSRSSVTMCSGARR